jgi:3D (Asp-Asp-Asp) domain-containing protein
MTPIPPPKKKVRESKRPADRAMMVAIAIVAMIGMILGWIIRDVAVRADAEVAEQTVEQTERIELKRIAPEPVIAQSAVMERTEPEPEPELISLGKFTITAFCPCEICCGKWSNPDNPTTASGAPAVEGVTVASDWLTLPKGTEIYIDGVGSRTVQDKPAKWIVDKYDGKIIDLYFDSHQDAWNFGKQELEVWTYEAD